MANPFFKFKQFTVDQEGAAMKVCTDSCLFGAILADYKFQAKVVLDIGTGTGLLSLMYAQQHPESKIDAIEIDGAACNQAKLNFENSLWPSRFLPIHGDLRAFKALIEDDDGYDLIFSNPPFFEKDLKTTDRAKNKAWHSTELNFPELVAKVVALLKPAGIFAVLVPYLRRQAMRQEAEAKGLFLFREVHFKHTANHAPFRAVQFYKRTVSEESDPEEIIIRDANQQYSLKFTQLLHPYYLYL